MTRNGRALRRGLTALGVLTALAMGTVPATAQNNPGFFIPPSGPSAPAGGGAPTRPPPRPTRPPSPPAANIQVPRPEVPLPEQDAGEPPPRVELPPVPDLPALPRANAPPAAVVGVISVPDIMRISTAAQQVDKALGERRDRLNSDVQKEQMAWRDAGQQLQSQRGNLNAEQIRSRERELQERITTATKAFRDRNRWVQEAAQLSYAQIENELIAVIRQVSESRGMNLVLHRSQVALNANEFDISSQVADQLNKLLPSVTVPPDGSSPLAALAAQQKAAQAAGQGTATPANAPGQAPAATTTAAPAPATPPAAGQPAPPTAPNAPRR